MLNGKEPKGLTDDELKTVNDTDVEKLFNNAKRGCYNYGCLKTSNGTDSIIHAAGNERFDSSMKTLSGLNELGVKLHLCEPAAALRDEAQREMLQHRRDKNWLAQNVENLAAKTIYEQTLLNKGVSEAEQKRLLEDASLNAEVEKIKADKSFKEACCLLLPEFDRVVIKLFDRHSGVCLGKVPCKRLVRDVTGFDRRGDLLELVRYAFRVIVQAELDEHHRIVIRIEGLAGKSAVHIEYSDAVFHGYEVISALLRDRVHVVDQALLCARSVIPERKCFVSVHRGGNSPFRECAEGIKHADSEKCRKGDDGDAAPELELLFQTIHV